MRSSFAWLSNDLESYTTSSRRIVHHVLLCQVSFTLPTNVSTRERHLNAVNRVVNSVVGARCWQGLKDRRPRSFVVLNMNHWIMNAIRKSSCCCGC